MDRVFKKMSDATKVDLKSYCVGMIEQNPEIKIYIGTDSQNISSKTVFVTTVVFRFENHGAHVIYHKEKTKRVSDLWTRLWGELQRSIDVAGYLKFEGGIDIHQIDLDINSDPMYPSNKVLHAAVGYAQSLGYNTKTKPEELIATWAADLLCN
ncbi:MAG: hypothetical protein HKO56_00980 [Bacteroidia bacterium]|nr:hypothetical protein [Bacteroidia bacterium]NNM15200.1 hypothetical protein [Bacteroidia bacterium]